MRYSPSVAASSHRFTADQVADLLSVVLWADMLVIDEAETIDSPARLGLLLARLESLLVSLRPVASARAELAAVGRRVAVGRLRGVGGPAACGDARNGGVLTGIAMKAAVGTDQPEGRVDAIVGGGIDSAPGRLLSIGQLQSALRAVHGQGSQPVELESEALAATQRGDQGDSQPGLRDGGRLAPTRPSGLGAVIAKASGLPNLRRLLSAAAHRTRT